MGYDNPLRFSAYGRRFEYPPFKSPVDYIEQCQDQRQTNERFLSGLRYILNRVSEWCYEIVSGGFDNGWRWFLPLLSEGPLWFSAVTLGSFISGVDPGARISRWVRR